MNRQLGKIRWFDSMRGEGIIRDDVGISHMVHFSAFYTPTDRNFHYPSDVMQEFLGKNLVKGTNVEFEIKDGTICRVNLTD